MKRVNWFLIGLAIVILGFLAFIYWFNPAKVGASHYEKWGEWVVKEKTACVQTKCGESAGTQDVSYQRTCVRVNGNQQDQCNEGDVQTKVCPVGYPNVSQGHNGYCYKGSNPNWDRDYSKMVDNIVIGVDCEVEAPVQCEPEPEPEPEPEVVRVESPLSEAGAPSCDSVAPAKIPNIFVENAGVGKLEVRWIPTGGDKAHIFYGVEVGKPTYSLIDTANDGVEVIGGLSSGEHYWFAVTNGGGCAWSSLSDWYDPMVE